MFLPILESKGRSAGGSRISPPRVVRPPGELAALEGRSGENIPPQSCAVRGVVSVGVDNISSLPIPGVVSIFGVFKESRGDRRAAILDLTIVAASQRAKSLKVVQSKRSFKQLTRMLGLDTAIANQRATSLFSQPITEKILCTASQSKNSKRLLLDLYVSIKRKIDLFSNKFSLILSHNHISYLFL